MRTLFMALAGLGPLKWWNTSTGPSFVNHPRLDHRAVGTRATTIVAAIITVMTKEQLFLRPIHAHDLAVVETFGRKSKP